jgi:antitoxin MazE
METAPVWLDQPADMLEEAGKLVIEPIQKVTHDVSTLVAGITDENRHGAIEMGPAIGREAW